MALLSSTVPVETGRMLVLLGEDATSAPAVLSNAAGIGATVLSASERVDEALATDQNGVVLPELGVAIIEPDPEQIVAVRSLAVDVNEPSVLAMEPETVVYAIGDQPTTERDLYLDGFRDGVGAAVEAAHGRRGPLGTAAAAAPAGPRWVDSTESTWGLAAVGALAQGDGGGVTVAVLDTGIDPNHPDLGALDGTASFVTGETVDDGHGHGTHCCGTVAGAAVPSAGARYGVAPGVRLLAGKVLGNQGSGGDGGILEGIRWALASGASVVSMSLGAFRSPGAVPSTVFETTARRALAQGVVIVAASGNDSRRSFGSVAALGHPANCPSICAIAAIDSRGVVADFSNGAIGTQQLLVAGPGVDVRSSWIQPLGYRTISGTSMATPHVAGVAARIAAEAGLGGAALRQELIRRASVLPGSPAEIGAGLVGVAAG